MPSKIKPNNNLYITKILRLVFLIYFKKNLIVNKENIKDKIIETKLIVEKFKSPDEIILLIPKIDTAPSVGIESKNDIFAASKRSKFNILAAVIVIPDLLTPGIKDNT